MSIREKINRQIELDSAAILKDMPLRIDGLWCDFCGRKQRPIDFVVQYYDRENRRWRGTCRDCSLKRVLEWEKQYQNSGTVSSNCLVSSTRHFSLQDYVLNYYTDDDFEYLDDRDIKRLKRISKRWSEPARKKISIYIAVAESKHLKDEEQLPM